MLKQYDQIKKGGVCLPRRSGVNYMRRSGVNFTRSSGVCLRGISNFSDFGVENTVDPNTPSTFEYLYDNNGNMRKDKHKSMDITYNILNLPALVYKNANNKIEYQYSATGIKLQKKVTQAGTVTTTDYIDNHVYTNTTLSFFTTDEGRVVISAGTRKYEYYITDHLGNNRVFFADNDNNGVPELLQSDDYYPFGLQINRGSITNSNEWLYNGNELENEFGLFWYSTEFRNLDPQIGRWVQIDPLSELVTIMSPFTYSNNNPINVNDKSGDLAGWVIDKESNLIFDSRVESQEDALTYYGEGSHYAEVGGCYQEKNTCESIELGEYGFIKRDGVIEMQPDRAESSVTEEYTSEQIESEIAKVRESYAPFVITLSFITTDASIPEPTDAVPLKWVGYLITGGVAAYYVAKMEKEIEALQLRTPGPAGWQYALVAETNGPFVCYTCPGGLMNLSVGDVWKYGETTNSNSRYSETQLATWGVSMKLEVPGTQVQIKIEEKRKIYSYFLEHGHLPPGNKIFR